MRPRRLPAVLLAVAVAATGCGKAAASAPPTTTVPSLPLTITQAVQLSSTLYEDHKLGGAEVDVQVPYSSTITVVMQGGVDFQGHAGHLVVVTDEAGYSPSVQDVDFTSDKVYTASPAAPGTPQTWTARTPDLSTMPIDRIIQLIVALSAAQRDNPLLVQQSQARWAGTRTLGGTLVDVYRYSPTITYWIGHSDGLLRRLVAVVQGIQGPVTIDLSDWGPHPSPPPVAS